jgi:hypothetical protein
MGSRWLGLQDFFKFIDILVFVEATIYQIDEANELYAKQGLLLPHAHSRGRNSVFSALEGNQVSQREWKAQLK